MRLPTGRACYIIIIMRNNNGKVAVFWDQSYLWGLIAFRAFRAEGVDFDLLTADDIRAGLLKGYDLLFVPGGWASDKMAALGEDGAKAVRTFIEGGGGYLGFCGGAGLALTHDSGLGLLPVRRLPTGKRLPSFSGTIRLHLHGGDHPVWSGVEDGQTFHAWWPGQFSPPGDDSVQVLAEYGDPGLDAFVTDLPVRDGTDWQAWEENYGINLDPGRIRGEPALIESRHGAGKVLLSYIHFETPGDLSGRRVLMNLLSYMAGGGDGGGHISPEPPAVEQHAEAVALASSLAAEAMRFDRFGMENLLWYRRRDWLLQWRRGVRGIEYSTLDAMLKEIANHAEFAGGLDRESNLGIRQLAGLVREFYSGARRLLMLERLAMARGPLSPLKCDDPRIQELRSELFSSDRRCGGRYRRIAVIADAILLRQLRRRLRGG
ncbi:hypothetical protein BMS3Abin01_00458 [bacterium BMS3Abin01]|nr:hypothetical protein BMS3Abin01_00458 [bacterium BMS3Abin01]